MKLINGDCIEEMKKLPANSVDSIVTDPPAGISFMSKKWDSYNGLQGFQEFIYTVFKEAYRVLKPGGHGFVWAIPRTSHHTAMGLERAGFEIRDVVNHIFGSGFPKSLNVSNKLNTIIPSNLHCVCDHHLKGKVLNSQDGYLHVHDSNDGQLLLDRENVQDVVPLQDDVHEHNHVCLKNDGLELKQAYNLDRLGSVPLSNEDFSLLLEHLEVDSQENDNILSDSLKNKLLYELKEIRKKVLNKSCNSHSVSDSVSSVSYSIYPIDSISRIYHKCNQCFKYFAISGKGTALKPAVENWILIRKPLSEKNVALNVLKWGTGGINIDGCRIEMQLNDKKGEGADITKSNINSASSFNKNNGLIDKDMQNKGRFPANIILDEEAGRLLDEQSGDLSNSSRPNRLNNEVKTPPWKGFSEDENTKWKPSGLEHNDSGGASRFFYCAKASRSERNAGCENLDEGRKKVAVIQTKGVANDGEWKDGKQLSSTMKNNHPTVKPIKLMQYLIRLVTPKGGVVLDPFLGSGTTGIAAHKEGVEFIGIEKEAEYSKIAKARINHYTAQKKLA